MEADHTPDEWEHIQSPFSAELIISKNSDSIAIKDDFYGEPSAFPPRNHEDLPINTDNDDDNHHLQESEPSNPPSPSDGFRKSKSLHFGAIQTGIVQIADRLRKSFSCKVGYLSVAWTAGGVAAVLLVLFLRRRVLLRRKRRTQLESSNRKLVLLITEKDKKINDLSLQIVRMNEALLARRKVPVIRVK